MNLLVSMWEICLWLRKQTKYVHESWWKRTKKKISFKVAFKANLVVAVQSLVFWLSVFRNFKWTCKFPLSSNLLLMPSLRLLFFSKCCFRKWNQVWDECPVNILLMSLANWMLALELHIPGWSRAWMLTGLSNWLKTPFF